MHLRIDPFSAAVVTIMINSGAISREITVAQYHPFTKAFAKRVWLGLAVETIPAKHFTACSAPYAAAAGQPVIISIKDNSLFYCAIGVAELTSSAEIIAGNFRASKSGAPWAVFYLIITLVLSFICVVLKEAMKIL